MKRFILIVSAGLLISTPLVSRQAYAASATMSLSPASASVAQGSFLTISVRENSGSEPVNAASVTLSYPADKLTFVSNTASAFPIVAASSGGGGSVRFDGGRLPPPVTGSQTIVKVKFKAKTNSGTAAIAITSGSVISSNNNQDIAGAKTGGNYTLTNPPPATPQAPQDTIPPTIKAVAAKDLKINSATITWTTSEPASSEVDYGLNKGYGLVATDAAFVTDHKIVLSSALLTPGTQYHYMVKSADPAGNAVSSADGTFTTKGAVLAVTVVNQKNKPVSGAKVTLGDATGTTDKAGHVTLSGLPLGKQSGIVEFKGHKTAVSTDIKSADAAGKAQPVTFKIKTPPNYLMIILLPLLLLLLLGIIYKKRSGGFKGPKFLSRFSRGVPESSQSDSKPGILNSQTQPEPPLIRPKDSAQGPQNPQSL